MLRPRLVMLPRQIRLTVSPRLEPVKVSTECEMGPPEKSVIGTAVPERSMSLYGRRQDKPLYARIRLGPIAVLAARGAGHR
jgi:hypothetical protein